MAYTASMSNPSYSGAHAVGKQEWGSEGCISRLVQNKVEMMGEQRRVAHLGDDQTCSVRIRVEIKFCSSAGVLILCLIASHDDEPLHYANSTKTSATTEQRVAREDGSGGKGLVRSPDANIMQGTAQSPASGRLHAF